MKGGKDDWYFVNPMALKFEVIDSCFLYVFSTEL